MLFEETGSNGGPKVMPQPAIPANGGSARLHHELVATKEYLQSTIEDHASTLEELRAANEEAQAANEELETAQEELESANEELNTLNEELKISNREFSKVNRDLANLLESISIPLVMVGRDLRIRRFTRAIEPMLNLIASDVGRPSPIFNLKWNCPTCGGYSWTPWKAATGTARYPRLARPLVFAARSPLRGTGWQNRRRRADVDRYRCRQARSGLRRSHRGNGARAAGDPEPESAGRESEQDVLRDVPAVREETEGRLIYDLGNGQWNIPKLRELLENILPAHSTFRDFEVTHEFDHVGRKVMLLNASEIFNPNAQARTILLAIEDVTDRKQAEEALRTTNAELQHFAYALTHDLQEPLRMVVNFTELLAQEYAGKLGEEADTFISYSVEGALRIEALLKALLAYWEVTEREQDSFA